MDGSTVVMLMILFVVLIVALSVLGGAFFMVEQAQVALIERFGRFSRIAHAGLNMKIPMIEKKAGRLSLRVQQLNVKVETKTSDNVFVDIVVSVQYHVVEGKEFAAFYKLTNPEQQITAHVFDAVRSQVPIMTLDHVFEKKSDIEEAVSIGLKTKINNYGYDIDGSPVTDIQPKDKDKKYRLRHRRLAGARHPARRKCARGDERDHPPQPLARSRRAAGRGG